MLLAVRIAGGSWRAMLWCSGIGWVGMSVGRPVVSRAAPSAHVATSSQVLPWGYSSKNRSAQECPPIQLFDCLFNCFTYEKELIEEYMPSRGGGGGGVRP